MRICSTGCRLLLIAPALLLLLQVALALHHHHDHSYHDDEDSLHSFPTAFYPDHMKQDSLVGLATGIQFSPPNGVIVRNPDSPRASLSVLITDPPQSRAPPSTLLS
jgi:hypothetical protein